MLLTFLKTAVPKFLILKSSVRNFWAAISLSKNFVFSLRLMSDLRKNDLSSIPSGKNGSNVVGTKLL